MRPGQIRVFDGLRITTEHMEHLQGSFHSAVQDIREILGLGKVYHGFEVIAGGDGSIQVQPGLAFDFQKNRIVCDEPKTVEVMFGAGEDTKYVCMKYDQIEDGKVEDKFTLVWDSCSVVMQTTLPETKENLVPIAKLIKKEDGRFDIVSPVLPEQGEEPEKAGTEAEEPQEGEVVVGSESGETSPATETPRTEISGEPLAEGKVSAEVAKAPTEENNTVASPPAVNEPAVIGNQPRLQVRQGVIKLGSPQGSGNYLSEVILETLKRKLKDGGNLDNIELQFALAEKEVALDFPVSSLTCNTIMSVTFDMTEGVVAKAPETETSTPVSQKIRFQSTAHGEATYHGMEVSQVGISQIQYFPDEMAGGVPWSFSELTEVGVAHLPMHGISNISKSESIVKVMDVLPYVQFIVRVFKVNNSRFKCVGNLLWKGGINEEIIQKIETKKIIFTWETLVVWKALGES